MNLGYNRGNFNLFVFYMEDKFEPSPNNLEYFPHKYLREASGIPLSNILSQRNARKWNNLLGVGSIKIKKISKLTKW